MSVSSPLLIVYFLKDEYKERAGKISIKSERKGPLPYNTTTLKRVHRPPPSLSSLSLCLSLFLSHGQPNRNDVSLSPPAIDLTKTETAVICGRKQVLAGLHGKQAARVHFTHGLFTSSPRIYAEANNCRLKSDLCSC